MCSRKVYANPHGKQLLYLRWTDDTLSVIKEGVFLMNTEKKPLGLNPTFAIPCVT